MKTKTNYEFLIEFITQWIEIYTQWNEINKYLFNHTELYEQINISDYPEELFNFFAGKITRYTTDINKLYKILDNETKEQVNMMRLLNRRFK